MKVVFLDIDGTCNNHTEQPGGNPMQAYFVGQLKRVLEATGAQIVWSTSWRRCQDGGDARLDAFLAEHGLVVKSIGTTPRLQHLPRQHEIRAWLKLHGAEVERFVVLDDDPGADLGDGSFVECAVNEGYAVVCGLTEPLADHAIRLLNQKADDGPDATAAAA